MAATGRLIKRSTVVAGAAAATAAAAAASTAAAVAWCSASLDPEQARLLGRRWVEEEATPGYVPPSASWPPPTEQPARSQIPALSAASAACGGADGGGGEECQRITFSLAVALLGGALFGHSPNDTQAAELEPTEAERAHGARLMRRLAEQGMPAALCGSSLSPCHPPLPLAIPSPRCTSHAPLHRRSPRYTPLPFFRTAAAGPCACWTARWRLRTCPRRCAHLPRSPPISAQCPRR